jgi:hypothetical protein
VVPELSVNRENSDVAPELTAMAGSVLDREISLLPISKGRNVLDIGCGKGMLPCLC